MSRVLIDFHHQGLAEALHLLFADRLGWEVYIQVGMKWRELGYWDIQPYEATAKQFLEVASQPYPEFPPLNEAVKEEAGISYVKDSSSGRLLKGITYDKFLEMDFDLVVASIPQHAQSFKRLADLKGCKALFQIGNMWAFDNDFPIKNILASAIVPDLPGFNQITYHQLFDTSLYYYEPPQRQKNIHCFINCLNVTDLYTKDWELFLELEKLLPEFNFKSYGGLTRDGAIAPQSEVARKTLEADFIFHVKQNGDGFSYGMHTAAACGRVIITRLSDYKGKLAEPLITSETCLIIDGKSPQQIAEELRIIWGTKLEVMSENMSNKFKETVDFEKENLLIAEFLGNLI